MHSVAETIQRCLHACRKIKELRQSDTKVTEDYTNLSAHIVQLTKSVDKSVKKQPVKQMGYNTRRESANVYLNIHNS